MLKVVVERYRNNPQIIAWQVENEPFFGFGNCPWRSKDVLIEEIDLVHSLDTEHPVVITDTGEFSLWDRAAKYGDIVGVTLYRKIYSDPLNMYISYPFTPMTYWRRAQIIKTIFNKETIGIELQTEPWGPKRWTYIPLDEQAKTMTPEKFRETIGFAEKTGFSHFYLWGGEWWYWLKVQHNDDSMWKEATELLGDSY